MESFRYTIRPYGEGDLPAFRVLFEAAFGHPIPVEVWAWKYAAQPSGPRQLMVCFHENGEMIACFGCVHHPGRIGTQAGILKQGTDQMCHPRYPAGGLSRKGFFVQTAEAFFDEFNERDRPTLSFGFPGMRHFRLGEKLLWYVRQPKTSLFMELPLPRLPAWKRLLPARPRRGVRRVRTCDARMDRLWDDVAEAFPTMIARDAAYCRYRYLEGPFRERYRMYVLSDGAEWAAAGVTGVMDGTARIMELVVRPGLGPRELEPLVSRMLADAVRAGARVACAWMPPDGEAGRALAHVGFVPAVDPVDCVLAAVDTHPGIVETLAKYPLCYTMGDADIF